MIARLSSFAAFTLLLTGCSSPQDKDIQGSWRVVSMENSGQVKPKWDKAMISKMVMTFSGDKYTLSVSGKDEPIKAGTFRVNLGKDPKEVDVIEPDNTKRSGIYKIEGAKLTFCLGTEGEPRPTAFDANAGKMLTLFVLERLTP
jgi:uncharacterized protein (TIGR03067 family)